MIIKTRYTVLMFALALVLLAGCQTQNIAPGSTEPTSPTRAVIQPEKTEQPGLANPASENCAAHGGTLTIETRRDGGQFGVCYFEDNQQCEEWALLRGDCPVGGLKVTGYATDAGRYCAISGGTYSITGSSGASDEQGTCTLKDGTLCDAWDFYNGSCTPGEAAPGPAAIQPLVVEVCNGQAQAMAHALDILVGTPPNAPFIPTQSEEPLSDPVTNASGMGCQATIPGTGEQFKSPDEVVKALGSMLEEVGWTEDPMLAAGGSTGIGAGYRKGDQICLASAGWTPDASANCPKDQPISACPVKPEQQLYTVTLNCGVAVPAE